MNTYSFIHSQPPIEKFEGFLQVQANLEQFIDHIAAQTETIKDNINDDDNEEALENILGEVYAPLILALEFFWIST